MVPASIRTKNPGAMWPGAIPTKWGSKRWIYLNDGTGQGGGGHGNKIAIFETYVQGICAQLDLWRSSPNYKNKPFSQAIAVWSGHNGVEAYIAHVLKKIPGMRRDTVMNEAFWSGPMGPVFLKVQASHEAGIPSYPAPDADWLTAQALVMGGKVKAPPSPATKNLTPIAVGTATAAEATRQGHHWGVVLGLAIAAAVVAVVVLVVLERKRAKDLDNQIAALQAAIPADRTTLPACAPIQALEPAEKPADAPKVEPV